MNDRPATSGEPCREAEELIRRSAVANADELRALIASARDVKYNDPAAALTLARANFQRAEEIGDRNLILDAVLSLSGRLLTSNLEEENRNLIALWKEPILNEGTAVHLASLCNGQAVPLLQRSHFTEALLELQPALDRLAEVDHLKLRSALASNAGNCYSGLGSYDRAVEFFFDAMRCAQEAGDEILEANSHNNIGIIYRRLGENDRALEEFTWVRNSAEKRGDRKLLARAYTNLMGVHFGNEDWDGAMECVQIARRINEELGDKFGIQACLTNEGAILHKLQRIDEAAECFIKALPIAREIDHSHQISTLLMNMGHIEQARQNWDRSLDYFSEAARIAEKMQAQDLIVHIIEARMSVNASKGDYQAALDLAIQMNQLREDIFHGRQRDTIEDLRVKYESEQKEQEAKLLREKTEELEREIERRKIVEADLKAALAKIRVLAGFIPVCAACRKVRGEDGTWHQMESYIRAHSDAEFTHGYCPTCASVAIKELEAIE